MTNGWTFFGNKKYRTHHIEIRLKLVGDKQDACAFLKIS